MILAQARAYGGCVGEDAYAAADDAACGEKCEAFCNALTSNTQVKFQILRSACKNSIDLLGRL